MNKEERKVLESIKTVYDYMKKNNYLSMPVTIKDPEDNTIRSLKIHIYSNDPKYTKMVKTRKEHADFRRKKRELANELWREKNGQN